MICHCGMRLSLNREKVLKVSGLRHTQLRCNNGHLLHLLEGVPQEIPEGLGRQAMSMRSQNLECAANASAFHRLITGLVTDSDLAWLARPGASDPLASSTSARNLLNVRWLNPTLPTQKTERRILSDDTVICMRETWARWAREIACGLRPPRSRSLAQLAAKFKCSVHTAHDIIYNRTRRNARLVTENPRHHALALAGEAEERRAA